MNVLDPSRDRGSCEQYKYMQDPDIVYCLDGDDFVQFLIQHKYDAFIDFPNPHGDHEDEDE